MTAPRPWKVNHGWSGRFGHCADDSPILDANDQPVIEPTESIDITAENLQLIVDAVNAYAAPPAALAEPLFLLHTGAVYGNERGDWEIEANSGKAVDAYCDANPGKTVGLYLAAPAQQPAAAVPEGYLLIESSEVESICRTLERDGDEYGIASLLRDALNAAAREGE